jgi:hypothetical protein
MPPSEQNGGRNPTCGWQVSPNQLDWDRGMQAVGLGVAKAPGPTSDRSGILRTTRSVPSEAMYSHRHRGLPPIGTTSSSSVSYRASVRTSIGVRSLAIAVPETAT